MRHTALTAIPFISLAVDRILKYIIFKQPLHTSGEVVRFGILSFTPYLNNRLAFSFPFPLPIIILGSIMVICLLIWCFITSCSFINRLALLCIITGALSNLFDRIAYHAVRDYLSIIPNGFFNIADLMIGAGILLLLVHYKEMKP